MKKLILLTGILFEFFTLFANMDVVYNDTLQYGRPNMSISFGGFVTNNDAVARNIRVTIISHQVPNDWGVSFCTPSGCFGVGVTTNTFSLNAGESGYVLIELHTGTGINSGNTTIRFENLSNAQDTREITFYGEVRELFPVFTSTSGNADANTQKRFFADIYNNNTIPAAVTVTLESFDVPNDWGVGLYSSANGMTPSSTGSDNFSISPGQSMLIGLDFFLGTSIDTGVATIRITNDNNPSEYYEQTFSVVATPLPVQTFSVEYDSVPTIIGSINPYISYHGTIINLDSLHSVTIAMTLSPVSLPAGWQLGMCTINGCFSPGVLTDTFTLLPGQSSIAWVDFFMNEISGSASTNVIFTDINNPASTYTETLTASSTLVGIDDQIAQPERALLSNPYPMPAISQFSIDYALRQGIGTIELSGMNGQKIATRELSKQSGTLTFENLSTGTYLLTLKRDGKVEESRKVLILNP